jgi:hypothetical protein
MYHHAPAREPKSLPFVLAHVRRKFVEADKPRRLSKIR